jgi:hypothetical protein
MDLIIKLIAMATLGAVIQNFEGFRWFITKVKLDFKPFNCTLCFTFWLTLIPLMVEYGLIGLAYASSSAVLAEIIDRQLNDF